MCEQETNPIDLIENITQTCVECNAEVLSVRQCENCRKALCDDCVKLVHNEVYCADCFSDNFTYCDRCIAITRSNESIWMESNETQLCEACADRYTSTCDNCQRIIFNDDCQHDDNITICQSCWDNGNYYFCESCECIVSDDYCYCEECDGSYCNDCYNENHQHDEKIDLYNHGQELQASGSAAIADYHPEIEWEFKKSKEDNESDPYFGVELEIEGKDQSILLSPACKYLGKELQGKILCSYDGSLSHGFEIVFTPHKKKEFFSIPFRTHLKELSKMGMRSFEGARCGLHVHLSRKGYLRKEVAVPWESSKHAINGAKCYQILVNTLREDIKRFSRRTPEQIEHYCNFSETSSNRYCAVNLTCADTVEVRIWRGTLEPSRFKANILFTLCLLDFLKAHSFTMILNPVNRLQRIRVALKRFIEVSPEYQFLARHFKNKKLFGF